MTDPAASTSIQERLSELFGSYKAEWLREHVFDLFTEPSSFPELRTPRPCILIVDVGQAKQPCFAACHTRASSPWEGATLPRSVAYRFMVFYYRVNTNRGYRPARE